MEAVERSPESQAGCAQTLHQTAGVRGAMAGLMAEAVENHVRTPLVDRRNNPVRTDSK